MSNLWETHAGLFEDAEQVVITDESPVEYERQEPTFYARVPKLAIMSLNPYELALYTHYKQTASDHGYCNKSNATLARETKMSVSKIRTARQSLLKQGFISVEHIPDESGIINQPPVIKIVDIWQKNHDTYSEGVVTKKQGGSYQKTTPSYQKTPKKNLSKKNQDKKDSSPSDDVGAVTPRKPRKRNEMCDAVTEHLFETALGTNPETEKIAAITGAWLSGGKAPKNLNIEPLETPLTPGDVISIARFFRRAHPDASAMRSITAAARWTYDWIAAGKPASNGKSNDPMRGFVEYTGKDSS